MRLFEFLLFIGTSFLLVLVFFNKKVLPPLVYAVFMVITLVLHYFFEGFRWQMCPIYAIVFLVLMYYNYNVHEKLKWFGKLALIVCFLFTLMSGTIAFLIPVFELPTINSKHAVGTSNLNLKDSKRSNRVLKIKFWFPTSKHGVPNGVYSENPVTALDGLFDMPGFLYGHLKLVQTETYKNAKVLEHPDTFPLVIYSHGGASTYIDNTALLRNIASNGYIVMAIDYNFSFEAYDLEKTEARSLDFNTQKKFIETLIKKVVPNQVEDIRFALDQISLKGFHMSKYIDFNNIVLMGHSLGGTTAADASLSIEATQAIINMDGPINPKSIQKIKGPVLYMSSFSPDLSENDLKEKNLPDIELYQSIKKSELEQVYQLNEREINGFHWVRFKNAGHLDFTDVPFMIPIMTTNGYDKHMGHELKTAVVIDFLNFSLKGGHFEKRQHHTLNWIP